MPSQIGRYEQTGSSITGNMLQTSAWEMLLLGNDWMGSRVSGGQQTSNGSLVRRRLPSKRKLMESWIFHKDGTQISKDVHR